MAAVSFIAQARQEPGVQGFVHGTSEASGYVVPSDSAVLEKLSVSGM